MNKTQKIILSIMVTLILFVIAYSWSTSIRRAIQYKEYFDSYSGYELDCPVIITKFVNVGFYVLLYNWYVWMLFIIVSGGFNFWLFSDKKQIKMKDERD